MADKDVSAVLTDYQMPGRNLKMIKWVGAIPAVGVCTFCDRLFTVPLESLKRVADAQWNLNLQFEEHKCKLRKSGMAESLPLSSNQPC